MPLKNNTRFCGARCKRTQEPCLQPSVKSCSTGKCRMHGGLSRGPKKPIIKTGLYTKRAIEERKQMRVMLSWRKDLKELS